MAEIVGTIISAITLAALFNVCIESFDVIQTAKNQAIDLKKLTLKLNIERCRLWTWGQTMGLTQHPPLSSSSPLDSCPFPDVVEECLGFIVSLFSNSEALKNKYGCREVQRQDELLSLLGASPPGPIERLSTSFENFKTRNLSKMKQASLIKKGVWVIYDKKKFEQLVSEAKTLIDGLQDITKDVANVAGQDRIMRSRITTINDIETLEMVAEVCEKDHPRVSDAASTRADAISLSTTLKRDISDWADTIEGSDSDAETIDAIESWTATEMKHKLLTLLQRRSDRVAVNDDHQQDVTNKEHQEAKEITESVKTLEPPFTAHLVRNSEDVETTEEKEEVLEDMAAASLDEDFKDELTAIEQWFHVLSNSERSYAYYSLAQLLSESQILFFFSLFRQKATLIIEGRSMKARNLGGPPNDADNILVPAAEGELEIQVVETFSRFADNEMWQHAIERPPKVSSAIEAPKNPPKQAIGSAGTAAKRSELPFRPLSNRNLEKEVLNAFSTFSLIEKEQAPKLGQEFGAGAIVARGQELQFRPVSDRNLEAEVRDAFSAFSVHEKERVSRLEIEEKWNDFARCAEKWKSFARFSEQLLIDKKEINMGHIE